MKKRQVYQTSAEFDSEIKLAKVMLCCGFSTDLSATCGQWD